MSPSSTTCDAPDSMPASALGPVVVPAAVQASSPQVTPLESEVVEVDEAIDRPWVTVVWDDPVNLMHYVTYIFQKLFGYSKAKATDLMMKVHSEGKAVVSSGSRDKMENDVRRLHAAGLWATMQRDDT
ncbi:ATP-dependent Clp protease adapter ClpS [Rhodococcus sp. NPDC058521]|uniref:ATP-dependent Clp protease adapter ClpS n=1 Tax=Rhodococcus sp. NPDC058521 TaxID=3346536 RepID=UPI003651531D